jgi:hypothetical protein
MQAFRDRPQDLLDRHPSGGPTLSSEIVRYVGSDEVVLASVVELARRGNGAQRVAIGIGLAKTVVACSRALPGLEQLIGKAVAAAGITELATALAAGLSSIDPMSGAELAQSTESPIAGGSSAPGGTSSSPVARPGGAANSSSGTEFVTFRLRGSGEPPPSFSAKGVKSTYGATVSPTRR